MGLLLLISFNLHSQNVEFKSSNFKDKKEAFKAASVMLKAGNEDFEAALLAEENKADPEDSYRKALEDFEKAQAFNPDNADLNYKVGKCIYETSEKTAAIPYLNKAIKLNPEVNPDAYFILAQTQNLEFEFVEARRSIKLYKSKLSEKEYLARKAKINKQLKEIDAALNNPGDANGACFVIST